MKMKKITLNHFSSYLRVLPLLLIGLITMLSQNSSAQCSLACNSHTQVSLDANCEAEVTYQMILNGNMTSCPDGEFKVIITDLSGNVIPGSPVVTDAHLGKTWNVSVRDTSIVNGNECWGTITVEDKIDPTISCDAPAGPIYCYQIDDFEPVAFDNCSAVVIETTDPIITINNCQDPNISDDVLMIVTQSYYAVDASGNISEECEFEFYVERIPGFDVIDTPDSYLFFGDTHLECDDPYAKLPNGLPSPVAIGNLPGTGVPYINTTPLYPSDGQFCNLITTYTDTELPAVGCVKKVMRKWDIFEWSCSSPSRDTSFIQMIEIVDSEGPTFDCPSPFIGSTSGHDCEGYVVLPALENLYDNCSDHTQISVDIFYDGGFVDGNGGIAPIPVGISTVTYVAYDECNNSTTCEIQVTIEDQTPPVTVCDQNTSIGLTNGGYAYVNAITFDDGSYDDCALESYVVRRMEDSRGDVACQPCNIPEFTEFTYLGEWNGHHYYISKWAKTARTAYRYAEALGGYVYSVNSSSENTAVNDFVKNVNGVSNYFIGLSDDSPPYYANKEWDDGSSSLYRNFIPYYYPGPYTSASVKTGQWNTREATEILPFIVEIEDVCGFSSYVKFCCEDVDGTDKQVVFRAIDAQGNYNDCMVNAEIQDKVRPTLTCPADRTVNCDFTYDPNRLSDFFGSPTYVGNCSPIMRVDSITDLSQCHTGTITRTFSLLDIEENVLVSCEQLITFENDDHFDIFNDVIEPPDREFLNGCADPNDEMFLPINTGVPTFVNEDFCDLVGYNYTDQVFTFNTGNNDQGTCFKILRTFNIIDWCAPENSPLRTAPYYQTIKVLDNVEPAITTTCDPVFQCTYDSQCETGQITLTKSASDTECSAILQWTAIVNPFKSSNPNDDEYFSGLDTFATFTDRFPVGTHSVLWTFADQCGNITSCLQDFTIANCKAPTPYCLNGLAVDLMPIDEDNDGQVDYGEVALWANDFDAGSFHPCSQYDVVVSFSENPLDTGFVFTCDSVGDAQVRIYATAVDAYGNYVLDTAGNVLQAYCNTFVSIQDNMNACSGNSRVGISGSVVSHTGVSLNAASVKLMAGGNELMQDDTDVNGEYAFADMPMGGSYMVSPQKLDDPSNGVSTLDLVLIQRHILGLKDLENAYDIIAADINHDELVSGSDVVILRKLILGKISEYPENDSWRFIDNTYQFIDATDPLGETFRENYNIVSLDSNMDIDFTAIKVGDVNNSASFDGNPKSENRSAPIVLTTEGALMNESGSLELPISMTTDIELAGMQFTLSFDKGILIENIKSDLININAGNMNIVDNTLTFSFHESNNISVKEGDVLFTIVYDNAPANSLFEMNSNVISSEIYDENLQAINLALEYRNAPNEVVLYQNTPNPFMESTNINVYMPSDAKATLSIYDVTGKLITTIGQTLNKGMNTISVSKEELATNGVLFYTLRTSDFTATKRMVVLK